MAPQKRPAASLKTVKASAVKKPKLDPVSKRCQEAMAGIRQALVPASVVDMFESMIDLSLTVPKEKRHEYQEKVVQMIGEVLQTAEKDMVSSVESTKAEIQRMQEEKESKEGRVKTANDDTEAKSDTAQTRKRSLAEQARVYRTCKKALESAEMEQSAHAAELLVTEKQREKYINVRDEDLKPLINGTEAFDASKVEVLSTTLRKFGFDESMIIALPNACSKPPVERGAFDNMVMTQLDEEMAKRIAACDDTLQRAEAVKQGHAEAVRAAAGELDKANGLQIQGADALLEAQRLQKEAEDLLDEAKAAVRAIGPVIRKLTKQADNSEAKLDLFRQDPLEAYAELRERITPPEPEETVEAEGEDSAAAQQPVEDVPMVTA